MKGIVREYVTQRGFGFINGEDDISYFFHLSDTDLNIKYRYRLDGVEVEFEPTQKTEADGLRVRYRAKQVHVMADLKHPDP